MDNWKNLRRLKLTHAEHLKPPRGSEGDTKLVGKHWIGAPPRFRNLRRQGGTLRGHGDILPLPGP